MLMPYPPAPPGMLYVDADGLTSLTRQDLVQLYTRAIAAKKGGVGAGGNPTTKDISKMTPAEKKKEIARRRAEAQKEKVRRRRIDFAGVFRGRC